MFPRYTEAVMVARPSIYISLAELTDTHQLLLDHRFSVSNQKSPMIFFQQGSSGATSR